MSDDPKDGRPQPRARNRQTEAPSADERDAAIARLERELKEERANSVALRETVDQLHFKMNILEKSYATQLAEARSRREKAETALAAHETRLAELGSGGEDTLKKLAEARAEMSRLASECSRLREHARGGRPAAPFARGGDAHAEDGSLTINELIADAAWAKDRRNGGAAGDANQPASVRAEGDAAPEVMLAPELVFTRGRDEDDER